LVEPGKTGWLVPASDELALFEAIRQALSAPVERLAAMGAAARAHIVARHNVRTEAAKLLHLFECQRAIPRRTQAGLARELCGSRGGP
jgi:glycosyltransferase involved in cell wall biosynthesis